MVYQIPLDGKTWHGEEFRKLNKRISELEATLTIIVKGLRLPSPKEAAMAKAMGGSVGLIATPGAVAALVALKAADEVIAEDAAAKGGG